MNSITQSLLPTTLEPSSLPVRHFSARASGEAAKLLLLSISRSPPPSALAVVGIAIKHSTQGTVELVALSTPREIFTVAVDPSAKARLFPASKDFEQLLSGAARVTSLDGDEIQLCLVGFGMARIAVHLYRDLGVRVHGVDLTTLLSPSTWALRSAGEIVSSHVCMNVSIPAMNALWSGDEQGNATVSLRAWISVRVGDECRISINNAMKVDTQILNKEELMCLGRLVLESHILDNAKPRETPNEFNKVTVKKDGDLRLQNARYRTRVRRSNEVILTNEEGVEFVGTARGVKGKTTTIKFQGASLSGNLKSVRVVGRQEPNNSEKSQEELIHLLLTGKATLRQSPLVRALWFPRWKPMQQNGDLRQNSFHQYGRVILESMNLNESQRQLALNIISDKPIVIAHGPPGTGKTTTISASAFVWDRMKRPLWIIAHSNVAVKNIAESLFKRGVNFRIIVSKEFYVEWHEHIYYPIEEMLLRSDELPVDKSAMERLLGGATVILSTLSMLSNPALETNGTFSIIPVESLIIDEASQIKVFDFLHIFIKFCRLIKVCFFGDPKQLPPYGKDKTPALRSIFDLGHLEHLDNTFLLDIQYRLPVPLGEFISRAVYGSKLRSCHSIKESSCLKFVNVNGDRGQETKAGFSWKNFGEIKTITDLVRIYYEKQNVVIITPYDAQRAEIEQALKDEGLLWEGRVYNVDSFQGNEADYVIISVVRTKSPGFLTSLNRMNVMLTRCRKGMVIVTNQSFLAHGGFDTLLGRLACHWETLCEPSVVWTDRLQVAEGIADFPGVLGPKKSSLKARKIHSIIRHSSAVPWSISRPSITGTVNRLPGMANWSNEVACDLPRRHLQRELDPVTFPILQALAPHHGLSNSSTHDFSLVWKRKENSKNYSGPTSQQAPSRRPCSVSASKTNSIFNPSYAPVSDTAYPSRPQKPLSKDNDGWKKIVVGSGRGRSKKAVKYIIHSQIF